MDKPGLSKDQKEIVRKLHEGQYSVQDILDLHGVIVDEAEQELEKYIKESIRKGYRCIKIIHGRGLRSPKGPILKEAVISWLTGRYRKNVIQCDGGLGALYILLR
jgi:DNA-nicking Smr family endonuclease